MGNPASLNLESELKSMLKHKFEAEDAPKKSTLRRNIQIEDSDEDMDDHNAFALDDYAPDQPMTKDIAARKRSVASLKKIVSFSGSSESSESDGLFAESDLE